jgi:uncharacterized protein
MTARFVLKTDGELFTFILEAGGNLVSGERYVSKALALKRIESVRSNAAVEEHYQRKVSLSGHPYFILRGTNNDILATSDLYTSRADRDAGIGAVKASGPQAELEDQTEPQHERQESAQNSRLHP